MSRYVLTIGVFDGVHLGHAAILRATLRRAAARRLPAAVVTFDRHPLRTLAPSLAPRCLMTLPQRLARLRGFGFRRVVVLPFTRALAARSAEAFVADVLVRRLRAAEVVVGYDFHFGKGGRGDAAFLAAEGRRRGFGVRVVPPVLRRGEPVSSTRIRRLLSVGNVAEAGRQLGRPFLLAGRRVRGRRLGRTIGFPTINLVPLGEMLPRLGVYAVRLPALRAPGVASFGVRPTVETGPVAPLLEVHVLGRVPPRLPERLETEFVRFLRPEVRFPSVAVMRRQIVRDAARARRLLASRSAA